MRPKLLLFYPLSPHATCGVRPGPHMCMHVQGALHCLLPWQAQCCCGAGARGAARLVVKAGAALFWALKIQSMAWR